MKQVKTIATISFLLLGQVCLGQPLVRLLEGRYRDSVVVGKLVERTIGVYGYGMRANYPRIDSMGISRDSAVRLMGQVKGRKQLALALLKANGRLYAEPVQPGLKRVNWKNYPFSVLLVPGEGPESYDIAISEGSKLRCRIAFAAWQKHLAPYIMVSGGRVHPYLTKYCEAVEMRRYLVDSLGVPKNAIILEPDARHTTTNMRNAVRLMIHYHFRRPGLVVAEKEDVDYISQMNQRCLDELGYVPYRLGKRIDDSELEFFTIKKALTIDATEPLDP